MTYLINAQQRKASRSTLYFEFQKGTFKQKHWLADSVYLHADTFDRLELYYLFSASLPDFDYYYFTEVSPSQYAELKTKAMACGGEIAAVFEELDVWVAACFRQNAFFTICGI